MTPTEFAVKTLYWFFLYGFIGWGVEVVYAAIKTHKLVNRGFLCGPICPIYGFGMVGLIYSVSLIPLPDSGSMSAVAIFFIGMILTTAIELVGGWALFKIYHIRWWDYSNMKFNLGGYICPQFSLLWGLGSVLMIKVVHPLLARGSSPMPFNIMLIVDVVLLVLFVVDVAASTAAAIGLNKYLREIDELRADVQNRADTMNTVLGWSDRVLVISQGDDATRWYYYRYELTAQVVNGFGGFYGRLGETQDRWDSDFMNLVESENWTLYDYKAVCVPDTLVAYMAEKDCDYILIDRADDYLQREFSPLFEGGLTNDMPATLYHFEGADAAVPFKLAAVAESGVE